jgi:hypothetical protein
MIFFFNADLQPLTTTQFPGGQIALIPVSYYPEPAMTYNALPNPFYPQATIVTSQTSKSKSTAAAVPTSKSTAAVLPSDSRPQSAASAGSQNTIERPNIASCRKLIKFFKDVSGSSDRELEEYIIQVSE